MAKEAPLPHLERMRERPISDSILPDLFGVRAANLHSTPFDPSLNPRIGVGSCLEILGLWGALLIFPSRQDTVAAGRAMKWQGGRVLIFGVAGFLGSNLARHLHGLGALLTGVDNLVTGSRDRVADFVDFHETATVDFDSVDTFDAVIHMASPASPPQYQKRQVMTLHAGSVDVEHAARVAIKSNCRFVYLSSSEAYGDPEVSPQPESYFGNVNPVGPRSMYDEAKRFGEAMCMALHREHELNVGVARLFNTYGPGMAVDDGRVIPEFFRAALEGRPLPLFGDGMQTRSLCYVDDTIRALAALVNSDFVGPINIGNSHEITMLELATMVQELVGNHPGIHRYPLPADDPKRRQPDISLAREVLDWRPEVTLRDGLERTLEWFSARVGAA